MCELKRSYVRSYVRNYGSYNERSRNYAAITNVITITLRILSALLYLPCLYIPTVNKCAVFVCF